MHRCHEDRAAPPRLGFRRSIRDIGELLEMSPADLDSVATFYNLIFRKPVGRHVIMLCDSVSCWIMGYERMREHLTGRLGIRFGETTPDNRFTLLPIVCLGACEQAPAMMVDNESSRGPRCGQDRRILAGVQVA